MDEQRPKSPGPPEAGDTAERIREAAFRHFAAKGYAGTAVRDVAAEVGVSPGVVTYHFKRKLDLFQAAVLGPYARFVADLLALVEDRSVGAAERLRRVIDRLAAASLAEIELLRAIFREILSSPETVKTLLGSFVTHGHVPVLIRAITEAVAEGALPAGLGPGLMPILLGGTILPALIQHALGSTLPDPRLAAFLRERAHKELLMLLGLDR